MKLILTSSKMLLALMLAGLACNAIALTLGPVTGVAVVGQPLNLSAALRLDDQRELPANCIDAELFYGDAKVASRRVQVSVETAPGQAALARVASSAVVDEPVVTLVLRAGCELQSVRRYLILADAPVHELAMGGPGNPGAVTASNRRRIDASTPAQRPSNLKRAANPSRPYLTVRSDPASRPASRLQLAVWEPGPEPSPWLRVSSEMRSLPGIDGPERLAAAALWQALSAQPQDLLRTADRLRQLEGEIAGLRLLSGKSRAEMATVRELVDNAHNRRRTEMILGALALLLAAGTATIFWRRSAAATHVAPLHDWYRPAVPSQVSAREEDGPNKAPANALSSTKPAVAAATASDAGDPGVAPVSMPDVALPEEVPTRRSSVQTVSPSPSPSMKVEALHNCHQQAEFFASLGQFDEAIQILGGYLRESSEPSAMAFLELLNIFSTLDQHDEFNRLRAQFIKTFSVEPPAYKTFDSEQVGGNTASLEAYPGALARIAVAWPSTGVLDTIAELLFHAPPTARDLFSLEAFRELVWLYSIRQETSRHFAVPAGLQLLEDGAIPTNHFITPWVSGDEEARSELSLERLTGIDIAAESSGFGVDIDLSDTSAERRALVMQSARISQGQERASTMPRSARTNSDQDLFDAATGLEGRRGFGQR